MRDDITLLVGAETPDATPWTPFDPLVVDFLDGLWTALKTSPLRAIEEISAFGFWCRRAHITALAQRHHCPLPRLGRGLIFHLAPSNVPTMFAYSYVIGLLAGNANLVRLSTRRGEVEEGLCQLLRQVLDLPQFAPIKARTALITYDRSNAITQDLLAQCDGRVLWGGDATISAMTALPAPAHSVDVAFPDRYSLALLSQAHFSSLHDAELANLAHYFYNDTYSMDQRACSSPQMILWLQDGGDPAVQQRWWQTVAQVVAQRYDLAPYRVSRKFEGLVQLAMTMEDPAIRRLDTYLGNRLYVAELSALPTSPITPTGGFGLFFQQSLTDLAQLLPLLSPKVQTLVCAGPDPKEVANFLASHHARGVTRVVPMGQAMEMDTLWDGQDLIAALSRMIQH